MPRSTKTIGDLVPDVVDALQGRTDATALAPRYIAKVLREITESNPFEELRTTGPTVVTTAGQAIYPTSFFLNAGDDYTLMEVLVIFVNPTANTVTTTLDYKTPKAIEAMIAPATKGLPSRWTRYDMNIHIGPTPDKAYSMYARYQIRYPFPADETQLVTTGLFIPPSWEDIVTYGAAERIAIVKRWNDQAKFLHDVLYGDPEFQVSDGKRGRPGLIAARRFQAERDGLFNSRQLMPIVSRYNVR